MAGEWRWICEGGTVEGYYETGAREVEGGWE